MDKAQITIRAIREGDIPEWLRMRCLLWDELSAEEHRSEMLEIYEHRESQLVVVADTGNGGRLAGFLEASIRPFVEDCDTDNVGYLEGWFVDPDWRRRGIGSGLVSVAEEWARSRGCTEMASDSEIGNDLSLEAHTALGYAVTSRLVHLRKELDR